MYTMAEELKIFIIVALVLFIYCIIRWELDYSNDDDEDEKESTKKEESIIVNKVYDKEYVENALSSIEKKHDGNKEEIAVGSEEEQLAVEAKPKRRRTKKTEESKLHVVK